MSADFGIKLNPDEDLYTVVFLLQPHFSMLAFTAAADALTTANLVIGRQRFRFITISTQAESVVSDLGIEIKVDCVLTSGESRDASGLTDLSGSSSSSNSGNVDDADDRRSTNTNNSPDVVETDAFIVCGGYRCALAESRELSALLQPIADLGIAMGGLWNGIVAIAQAGLMSGYACALHPDNQPAVGKAFPEMEIRSDTVVIDRNRLSAAGPNSAFDLMLLLIQRHDGADAVQSIRNILRADIGSTGAANQNNALRRDAENKLPSKLQNALHLMRSNLDEPLDREDLARHISMSTRAMERLFQKYLDTSPAKQYMELRLMRSQELLAQTDSPIGEISDVCGFVSSAHFSRAFSKRFGCAPKQFRKPRNSLIDV